MGKYFGTDGFRGEANVQLTVDNAFKVGRYVGSISHQQHYLSNCRCLPSKMRYHVHRNRKRYQTKQLYV